MGFYSIIFFTELSLLIFVGTLFFVSFTGPHNYVWQRV